jgi:hypothetical protein
MWVKFGWNRAGPTFGRTHERSTRKAVWIGFLNGDPGVSVGKPRRHRGSARDFIGKDVELRSSRSEIHGVKKVLSLS